MKLSILPLILLSVLLNSGAQLSLKAGVGRAGAFHFAWSNIVPFCMQLASNPWILLSLACYVVSIVVWIFVLARIPVSIAYPLISLGYVVNAVAAHYLLGEDITFLRIAGIMIILLGVVLVAKS